MAWATYDETQEEWRNRTISTEEKLEDDWLYDQYLAELRAEEEWLRTAEYDERMNNPKEW